MKKEENDKIIKELSVVSIHDSPVDAFEMVNAYGTYEIQRTADTKNEYPAIAQGFNKKLKITDGENKRAEKNRKNP